MTDASRQFPIVGSLFGLEEAAQSTPPEFISDDSLLLANGRCGIFALVLQNEIPRVWMPSYACAVMEQAAVAAGAQVEWYPVSSRLTIDSTDWCEHVQAEDLVILIDYFGFPCDRDAARAAAARGAWILEDACQALLSRHRCEDAHFILHSPRKTVAVPSGGVLTRLKERGAELSTPDTTDETWEAAILYAAALRQAFDQGNADRDWYRIAGECEERAPLSSTAMSPYTEWLLRNAVDFVDAAEKRRRYYTTLHERIGTFALMPELDDDTVPLGFPLRLANRDEVRDKLFETEIYPPVHWNIEGLVPDSFRESHRLHSQTLTIPSDQRCTQSDIDRIADIVSAIGAPVE